MSFRRASVLLAALFVLIHSYLIYVHGISLKLWLDMREVVDILAFVSVCIALAGGSIWCVAGGMLLATVWIFPTTVMIVQGMVEGVWDYSRHDVGIFSLAFLPPFSFLMALLADGRWRYLKSSFILVDQEGE